MVQAKFLEVKILSICVIQVAKVSVQKFQYLLQPKSTKQIF